MWRTRDLLWRLHFEKRHARERLEDERHEEPPEQQETERGERADLIEAFGKHGGLSSLEGRLVTSLTKRAVS